MKTTVVFIAFLAGVLSGPAPKWLEDPEDGDPANMKYFLVEREDGTFVIEDLTTPEKDVRRSEFDVTYHYYSKSSPSKGSDIRHNNVGALSNTPFTASKDTLFIVHGWNNNQGSAVNYHIREAVLAKHDVNVFVVDWGPIADRTYLTAKNSVVDVGKYVATFIRSLVSTYGVELSKVALVGHSLGAHVAGNAGAALGGQVRHIVGLDPAGPLFSYSNTDNRLDPTDAKFVQVIHTNGGLLGLRDAIGHADYFPNGGASQTGCGIDIAGTCAHSRAYEYYAESIAASRNLYVSTQCVSYSDYSKGRCAANAKSAMGGFSVDTSARGEYYLDTYKSSPYGQG